MIKIRIESQDRDKVANAVTLLTNRLGVNNLKLIRSHGGIVDELRRLGEDELWLITCLPPNKEDPIQSNTLVLSIGLPPKEDGTTIFFCPVYCAEDSDIHTAMTKH